MKRLKLLSSFFILSFIIVLFSIMFFSFGIISFKKENISSYSTNLITSYDNFITEESGWSLEQLSTSTDFHTDLEESTSNSSVILTDPEGNDYAFAWGSNNHGQLGIDEESNYYYATTPKLIYFSDIEYSDIKFLSIHNGLAMAVLTDESGEDFLYTWGDNSKGQLGLGASIEMTNVPILVTELPEYDEIKFIDTGAEATAIILTIEGSDTLWTTGYNVNGELGLGNDYDNDNVFNYTQVIFPENIDEIININFSSSSTVVVTINGENILYTWGKNNYYQSTPDGDGTDNYNSPVKYNYLPNDKEYTIKEVVSTGKTTLAVLTDESGDDFLYAWGNSTEGQAGIGTNDKFIKEPTLVEFPDGADIAKIKEISMGGTNSSAVTIDQNGNEHIYFWGQGLYFLMGNNHQNDALSPTEVVFDADDDYIIKEISWGESYAGMIVDYKGSNQLYMWGRGWTGTFGPNLNTMYDMTIIKEITKLYQTPMITFDNDLPSVVNSDLTMEKILSFTLNWEESSVTPTKLEIIDSNDNFLWKVPFNKVESGIKTEINIIDIAPEGIDNVRLRVSDDNKTLVFSQSFDIPSNVVNEFTGAPVVNYNWMTAKKNLSFTLFYYPDISLKSIKLVNKDTGEILEISIRYEEIKSKVEYNADISKFTNSSTIKRAYIEVEVTSGSPIRSDVFEIPATKIKGWVIIVVTLIVLLAISILSTTLIITYKIRAKNKIQKMKAYK